MPNDETQVAEGWRNHAELLAEIERDWAATGLSGSFLARNLDTGVDLGFGADLVWPLASVVKLPIALVLYDAMVRGELDAAEQHAIEPDSATNGPTGISLFRQPCRVATEDLVQLSLAVSDNAATDLLLDHYGLARVTKRLAELGLGDIVIRHPLRALYGTDSAVRQLGAGLTASAATAGGGHIIAELDPSRANAGSARALLDLLDRVWTDRIASPEACARLRSALGHQLTRHRMAVELASDGVKLLSKTGTFLDLRHEAGVFEAPTQRIAVVALTRSASSAVDHLEADFAIGHAARLAVEALRE